MELDITLRSIVQLLNSWQKGKRKKSVWPLWMLQWQKAPFGDRDISLLIYWFTSKAHNLLNTKLNLAIITCIRCRLTERARTNFSHWLAIMVCWRKLCFSPVSYEVRISDKMLWKKQSIHTSIWLNVCTLSYHITYKGRHNPLQYMPVMLCEKDKLPLHFYHFCTYPCFHLS